ncbi:hypothetical protein C2E21_1298 [Chlorella sorokiniana]|uniref:Uncharacterized protein n=1 Tax=Chlorella sorokiniana TaxID=3076 RepID=A0A2P6U3F3_CHLSO|nr:hypothetical protein C2E21_1298 [Chlorella sorokiniana]|eukprot:PRW60831.1 hypothetical protein C2E21_1298 [Chlorella sorokiniana]
MRCFCLQTSPAPGGAPARARSTPRSPPAAAAAPPAAATPLPLLPFWQEFRSQVARLEGVEALPLSRALATAQSAQPPVSLRAGACHSDRLRFGHFVYVNAGAMGKWRRPGRRHRDSTAGDVSASSSSSSPVPLPGVSLLQGTLLPSLFSFHPPLAFQALAFNGGQSWMVAMELGTLQAAETQQPSSGSSSSSSSSGSEGASESSVIDAAETTAAATAGAAKQTVDSWQAGQVARFAALRQLYPGIAAPLPAGSPLLPHAAVAAQPAAEAEAPGPGCPLLLFSSAVLQAGAAPAAEASLEREGLTAFRQCLALHLNGLASAPADASPQHVRRMAAAQLAWLREQHRRPLLCAAQLEAAFGRQWLQQLQEHVAAVSEQGLAELLASGASAAGQQQEQRREAEWVLVDPAQLLEGLS